MPKQRLQVYKMYTTEAPRGKGEESKSITSPYLEPNQSMKLTRDIGHIFTNTLDQNHKLYTKEYFSLWTDNSPFPNAYKFFSFHTNQKMHKGATCQAFLQTSPAFILLELYYPY